MNRGHESQVRRATVRAAGVLVLAFLAGCASSGTRGRYAPEPAVCADSVYVQLRAQHPDSLSEREWQRFQGLERECTAARAEASPTVDGRAGVHRDRAWWMASGLVMVVMMVAMWSPW